RQLHGPLAAPVRIARLQPRADPPVQPPAPGRRQARIHHLGIQGMAKRVAPGHRPIRPCLDTARLQELSTPRQPGTALLPLLDPPPHPPAPDRPTPPRRPAWPTRCSPPLTSPTCRSMSPRRLPAPPTAPAVPSPAPPHAPAPPPSQPCRTHSSTTATMKRG